MKKLIIAIAIGLLGITSASAAELQIVKEGTRVCVTEGSLSALHEALRDENDHAINWLTDGAACMITHTDMEVEVISVTEAGFTKIRTTRKRNNQILWTSAS